MTSFRSLGLTLAASASLMAGSLAAQTYSDLDRQRDQLMLDVVQRDLTRYYYDSTYGGLPISAMFDSARAQIGRSQSNEQSFGLIARVFLALHDSETLFIPPSHPATFDYGWEVECIGDSAYITRVDSSSDAAAQGVHVGDRVLAIDGVAIDRSDFKQFLYVLNGLQPRERVVLTIAADGRPPRQVSVATRVTPQKRMYDMSGFSGTGDLILLWNDAIQQRDQRRIHLLKVTPDILLWHMYSTGVPLDDLHHALGQAARMQTLILDLRENAGGGWKATSALLDALAPDSDAGVVVGRFFPRDPASTGALIGQLIGREQKDSMFLQPDAKHRFQGRLIVLVDGMTFGKGEIIADVVRRLHLGTVIGDRTAGTGTVVRLFTYGTPGYAQELYGALIGVADFRRPDGSRIEGVGVTPDETILPTPQDLRSGNDPVLARALAIAGHPVSPAEAGALDKEDGEAAVTTPH